MDIHGYEVVASIKLPDTPGTRKGLHVIMVDRDVKNRPNFQERYVVALWCEGDKEWMAGYYTHDIGKALKNLHDRAASNWPRTEDA